MSDWTITAAATGVAQIEPAYPSEWVAAGMMILIAAVFAFGVLILSALIGPSRTGPVKETPFESGVPPTGTAQRRFHVRYYVIALVFLLFDVEVVLLFPWAVMFSATPTGLLLAEMATFLAILAVGYVYAWRKGVLRFD